MGNIISRRRQKKKDEISARSNNIANAVKSLGTSTSKKQPVSLTGLSSGNQNSKNILRNDHDMFIPTMMYHNTTNAYDSNCHSYDSCNTGAADYGGSCGGDYGGGGDCGGGSF